MVGKIVNGIMAICSLIGGGYMIFQGESIGWIIAGFVGGAFAPIAVVAIPAGIIEGFFGKSKNNHPGELTPAQQRLARNMWAAGGRSLS